jgi:hypothetical protein
MAYPDSPKPIVVGIDGSQAAKAAVLPHPECPVLVVHE